MSRYRVDQAHVSVTPYGSRLLVRWESAAYFWDIRASFDAALSRHGERCWSKRHEAWSVSPQGRPRLERWLGLTFEPSCVEWREERAGSRSYAGGGSGHGTYQRTTDSSMHAAYGLLCLTRAAPPELVTVVHRWWARQLHPDTGRGDEEKMKVINNAVDVIRRDAERKKAS